MSEDLKEPKKEIPNQTGQEIFKFPGKKERILMVIVGFFRFILRFFEKAMIKCRQRRLAKRMDVKK